MKRYIIRGVHKSVDGAIVELDEETESGSINGVPFRGPSGIDPKYIRTATLEVRDGEIDESTGLEVLRLK